MEWMLLVATLVASTLFLLVVAFYVAWITRILRHFGGGDHSALAMIAWGVRAIDGEVALLPAGVPALNDNLRATLDGLKSIDRYLVSIAEAQV